MGEIMILEDILEAVTNDNLVHILFGKRNLVNMAGIHCDYIFHYIRQVPFERLDEDSLLVVPVLDYEYPKDYDEAVPVIGEIHKQNPKLTVFAIRDRNQKLYRDRDKREDKIKGGISLAFFDVCDAELGTEVTARDRYYSTNEELQKKEFGDEWEKIKQRLSELKKEIDKKYLID